MPVKKGWPEPSRYTLTRVWAWHTADHAVRQAESAGRATSALMAAAEECSKTFRGAAERDFMDQCRRLPTKQELDTYCDEIRKSQA